MVKTQPVFSKSINNAAPRFGTAGALAPNFLEQALYKRADQFLRLDEIVQTTLKNSTTLNKKSWVMGKFRGALKWLSKHVLDHDYKEVCSLNLPKLPLVGQLNLGRIVVEPPMGALAFLLFGFTLGGRIKHAINRAASGDMRELRDIGCRDIPTFILILYMLKPMVRWMSQGLQRLKGIELVRDGSVFGYSQLRDIYRIDSQHRLKTLLANSQNKKGVMNALRNALKNNAVGDSVKFHLVSFKNAVQRALNLVPDKGGGKMTDAALKAMDKHVAVAYNCLQNANKAHAGFVKTIQAGNSVFKPVHKMVGWFAGKFASPSEIIYRYARNSRVWANLVAYAVVIGALGFGVTAFNEWFTNKEYKRKVGAAGQPNSLI